MIRLRDIPLDDASENQPEPSPERNEIPPPEDDDTEFSFDEFEVDYHPDSQLPDALETECDQFFAPGGVLETRAAANGMVCEARPQQRAMAKAIAHSLISGDHLCVEAPTGVGKSFAYLAALIYRSQYCQRPAVISTETITLQEQLIHKDIPFLSQLMGIEVRAAIAKGRHNYLCRRRFAMLQGEQRDALLPAPSLVLDVERLSDWLNGDVSGGRDELDFKLDNQVWNLVACENSNCLGPKCPYFRNCFYFKARREWESADLIVANHALFFTDLAMRCSGGMAGALLPNYGAVLIDEAHTLENNAAEHLGVHVSRPGVVGMLNRLYNPDNARGLLLHPGQYVIEARGAAAEARDEAYGFFAGFENYLNEKRETSSIILHPENFPDPLSPKLLQLSRKLNDCLEDEDDDNFKVELSSKLSYCREYIDALDVFMHQTMPEAVYYAEQDHGAATLNVAPLNVADILNELLFNQDFNVILCSATLTVRNSFNYFQERTGFSGQTLRLDSPFSPQQAKIIISRQVPDPKSEDYLPALAEAILSSLEQSDGSAFVLFTSYTALRYCAEELRDECFQRNWRLLIQGEELTRSRMITEFKNDVHSVLFGTDSFWTGVDVPGAALSNVIITRLPFPSPGNPLISARMERLEQQGQSSFSHYTLPEAVLKFRQGAGRLIRNKQDQGRITILDSRVVNKNYGRLFIDSLPYPVEIVQKI